MKTNEEYIKEYIETRGLKKSTEKSLKLILNHYCTFQEKTIHELLLEADQEEEQGIRWKNRTIKTRLLRYLNFLRENMSINSAKTYFRIVKSFYTHHEIEIHSLPRLNEKNSQAITPITFKDLPTREIIKKAVELSEPLMKALILFLCSTGMSKVDALNLKIIDFINASSEYHTETEISRCIEKLNKLGETTDIIPVFKARRQKTNKYFITFCTHEATIEILNYLAIRNEKKELKPSDKLFKINSTYYTLKFEELNDLLGLKKVGSYNRFRGHMLRKFHSTSLSNDGMDRYLINTLQGKSNGKVDDVYFFEDENKLREEYLKHMSSLLLFTKVREVNEYSEEYLKLKKENEALLKQMQDIRKMKKEIEKLKEWFS